MKTGFRTADMCSIFGDEESCTKQAQAREHIMKLDLAQLEERVTVELTHMDIIRSVVRIRQSRHSFFAFFFHEHFFFHKL